MFDKNPPHNLRKLPFLPEEILVDEILARLPVKSLSRFKCVSNPWRSLIESDRFIEIHYGNSAKNPRVITVNINEQGINDRCSLQSLLEPGEESIPRKMASDRLLLMGCCNGVLCCYGGGRFSLWNPATRVSAELPYIEGYGLWKWGFGWDESSGAYKVFVVLQLLLMNERSGWVYSSNTNSWRKLPGGSHHVLRHTGLFLRGNFHWIDGSLPHVECFDLGREEFGRIELPMISSYNSIDLGVIGGNLSLLIVLEKVFDVWVMKEYGVKDSWLKMLTFPSTALSHPTNPPFIYLFGEGPNGEIFVRFRNDFRNNLTVYSPKHDAFSTVTTKDPFIEPHIYIESLVSPKRILDATNTTS